MILPTALAAAALVGDAVTPKAGAVTLTRDTVTLEERVDLFDPPTGAFRGTERTWFGPGGRRLRLEITDAGGEPTLLFFVRHDDQGRESEAVYFEGGSEEPDREVFTYSADGRLQTTTYYFEPGLAADRTEADLDDDGREIRKRYYRSDGAQYGEEDVLWDELGNRLGWDFRYVGREGGSSFRYVDVELDDAGAWIRRVRSRNGAPERFEVRTRITAPPGAAVITPVLFAPGRISTEQSEASPSFSRDAKTMVFARYGDDWTRKEPFIAYLEEDGWRVESLDIGIVYNLAISPSGNEVVYATRSEESRELFRIRREANGWSRPESLTSQHGITGTYPCLTDVGDLVFFDAEGASGAGIYLAPREDEGFGTPGPLFVPASDAPFDGYTTDGGALLVSRCFDDSCLSGSENGIWEVLLGGSSGPEARKLANLPYAWGAQPVAPLGLFVFTDGDDILAVPLARAGLRVSDDRRL